MIYKENTDNLFICMSLFIASIKKKKKKKKKTYIKEKEENADTK